MVCVSSIAAISFFIIVRFVPNENTNTPLLPDAIIIGLSIGIVYGLVALGVSLIYSGLDIVHFAHGEIFMFGAFFGLVLFKDFGIAYPITLFLAMILTGTPDPNSGPDRQ